MWLDCLQCCASCPHVHLVCAVADVCCCITRCRWLRKQARLLAKQKLSAQQRAMLQQLGVCLTVPKRIVQRTAQLQVGCV